MTATALALVLVVALEPQDARPPQGPAYVQGTLFLTTQPAGTPASAVEPALDGRSIAIAAQAGRFVTPQMALEGEFALGRWLGAPQTFTYTPSYQETYRASSRDLLFNGNLRWRPRRSAPIELVFGGGLAINTVRKLDRAFRNLELSPSFRSTPVFDLHEARGVLTLGGGIDVPLAIGRAAVVPGFRVRWFDRMSSLSREIGVSGYTFQLGGSLRGVFNRPSTQSKLQDRAYVQGSVFLATNPPGIANHRVAPPLGGETVGLAASAGAFVTDGTAIEGEFILGGALSNQQQFSYWWREEYMARVRDLLFNANLRSKPAKSPIELVVGGGLVVSRVGRYDQVNISSFGVRQAVPDSQLTEWLFNVGGGLDAPIAVHRRVALVPSFRYRWIPRQSESQSRYMGVGRNGFHAGVTVRFST